MRSIVITLCMLLGAWGAVAVFAPSVPDCAAAAFSPWEELETGLSLGQFYSEKDGVTIVAVRFDPAYFDFSLHMVSHEGSPAKSLEDWAEKHDLVAGINASMYLPDSRTSTGYMRSGGHINNIRVGMRLGAFFVAQPDAAGMPSAALVEKDDIDWQERIAHYSVVVQNFRITNARREILWPAGGSRTSIAAVGQDEDGHILFLHCREPIDAHAFAALLLELPLRITRTMYVEGGVQAGLVLRSGGHTRFWAGRRKMDFLSGTGAPVVLPNILGVRRKAQAQ